MWKLPLCPLSGHTTGRGPSILKLFKFRVNCVQIKTAKSSQEYNSTKSEESQVAHMERVKELMGNIIAPFPVPAVEDCLF